jgi:hypothetical protein
MPKFLKYGLFTILTFTTSTGRTKSPVQNTSSQDSLATVSQIKAVQSELLFSPLVISDEPAV